MKALRARLQELEPRLRELAKEAQNAARRERTALANLEQGKADIGKKHRTVGMCNRL